MIALTAGDQRRGVALWVHGNRGDEDGIRAILDEAADLGRLGELAVGVVRMTWEIIGQMRAPYVLPAVESILEQAGASPAPPGNVEAARLAVAVRRGDEAGVARVLADRSADTMADLVIASAALLGTVLPEIAEPDGLSMLGGLAAQAAAAEVAN